MWQLLGVLRGRIMVAAADLHADGQAGGGLFLFSSGPREEPVGSNRQAGDGDGTCRWGILL